jgi:hypothetical protein
MAHDYPRRIPSIGTIDRKVAVRPSDGMVNGEGSGIGLGNGHPVPPTEEAGGQADAVVGGEL